VCICPVFVHCSAMPTGCRARWGCLSEGCAWHSFAKLTSRARRASPPRGPGVPAPRAGRRSSPPRGPGVPAPLAGKACQPPSHWRASPPRGPAVPAPRAGQAGQPSEGCAWHSFAKLAPRCWQPQRAREHGGRPGSSAPCFCSQCGGLADVPCAECHGRGSRGGL
jgi:hypothetical protein